MPRCGRTIVLGGLPGSGKSSTAKALKKNHGFIYFEGDVWSWGDAVSQAEETPTQEMIATAKENIKKMNAIMAMGAEFYAKVFAGQEGNFDAAYAFYDLMMADVLKVREENPTKDIIVVHTINHKKICDHLLKCLGTNKTEIVCLDVPHDVLRRRNVQRLEGRAKGEGKTLKEFVMNFPSQNLPVKYEARLEQFTNPGVLKLEPLGDSEKQENLVHFVSVAAGDDHGAVESKVLKILRLDDATVG